MLTWSFWTFSGYSSTIVLKWKIPSECTVDNRLIRYFSDWFFRVSHDYPFRITIDHTFAYSFKNTIIERLRSISRTFFIQWKWFSALVIWLSNFFYRSFQSWERRSLEFSKFGRFERTTHTSLLFEVITWPSCREPHRRSRCLRSGNSANKP